MTTTSESLTVSFDIFFFFFFFAIVFQLFQDFHWSTLFFCFVFASSSYPNGLDTGIRRRKKRGQNKDEDFFLLKKEKSPGPSPLTFIAFLVGLLATILSSHKILFLFLLECLSVNTHTHTQQYSSLSLPFFLFYSLTHSQISTPNSISNSYLSQNKLHHHQPLP